MTGRALVLRGDARSLPLPDESVDLVVTSPPFYALRSYTDSGEHYAGQIGSEPTPAEYIATLVECTREWARVLKPTGSIFVDLGDSYYSGKGAPGRGTIDTKSPARTARRTSRSPLDYGLDFPRKSLLLLPERYRIACVDQLGLIARAVIYWHKPNGLPESVTDRVRRSHEDWVHLTKRPRYYSAVDEIREPASDYARPNQHGRAPRGGQRPRMMLDTCNPLGKLPGSVWSIPSEPLRVPEHLGLEHFAAFPLEWPLRLVAGWSPPGICTACGEGVRPVVDRIRRTYHGNGQHRSGAQQVRDGAAQTGWAMDEKWHTTASIIGYACACPEPSAPTRPAVVLDPFGGTGTTALAARALGRIGITVDRSGDYCRLAAWRTTDPGQLAKAMRVEKPAPVPDGQSSLFELAVDR